MGPSFGNSYRKRTEKRTKTVLDWIQRVQIHLSKMYPKMIGATRINYQFSQEAE